MTTINITMLGPFSISSNYSHLTDSETRSQKLLNVLSYIITHRDRAVSQAELIDTFWSDADGSINPANALKTIIYRIRSLLEPVFNAQIQPIISQRGAYCWNPEITCQLDYEYMEDLCRQAEEKTISDDDRIDLFSRAVAIYKGDFLNKLGSQLWLIPLQSYYHELYLNCVKKLAVLKNSRQAYEEEEHLLQRAIEIDQFDEDLHVLMVRALLNQGKNAVALSFYESATERIYKMLGIRPSEQLREVYQEILNMEQELNTDLDVIQLELKETAARSGAFLCEYGFFREIYRLEARRARRSGICVHIGLITVSLPNSNKPPLKQLNATMTQLAEVMTSCLRRGDVIAKYSASQYVVMLPAANFEDSNMILDRIVKTFYHQHRRNFFKLTYKIREIELN